MSETASIPELKRNSFFPGQRLTAEDLMALDFCNRELRWLHTRSLHAWGIGIGFEATGERGNSFVRIDAGYGADCLGREIILTSQRTKTVPAVASGPAGTEAIYYLVAAYQADSDQQVAERRPGVCQPAGTVRLTEEPLLDWRLPNDLQEGRELVLAKAWILNCQLSRPLSLAERRYARPAHQPYVYAGQTSLASTVWQEWKDASQQRIGVLTEVDTSLAGFRNTPVYLAHVAGERFLPLAPGPLLLVGSAAVSDAARTRFTLEVLLAPAGNNQPKINPTFLSQSDLMAALKVLQWHVVWMGIEG